MTLWAKSFRSHGGDVWTLLPDHTEDQELNPHKLIGDDARVSDMGINRGLSSILTINYQFFSLRTQNQQLSNNFDLHSSGKIPYPIDLSERGLVA